MDSSATVLKSVDLRVNVNYSEGTALASFGLFFRGAGYNPGYNALTSPVASVIRLATLTRKNETFLATVQEWSLKPCLLRHPAAQIGVSRLTFALGFPASGQKQREVSFFPTPPEKAEGDEAYADLGRSGWATRHRDVVPASQKLLIPFIICTNCSGCPGFTRKALAPS